MNNQNPQRRNLDRLVWLPLAGFWLLIGLVFASQYYLNSQTESSMRVLWGRMFAFQMLQWGFWAVLSLGIFQLTTLLPLERELRHNKNGILSPRRHWASWILFHFLAALIVAALHLVFTSTVVILLDPFPHEELTFSGVYSNLSGSYFVLNCIIYWAVLGLGYGIQFYRKYREGALRTSHLETQLVQAQLQALKMQLHPHFLFNTLNAISTLVRKNRNKPATDMIAGLSDLLRLTLESVGVQKVPLKQELDFLETYLEIEQIRFEDWLQIRTDIHPDTLEASVPNLLLQPLVENAIRHGIAPRAKGGCVEIEARCIEDRLWLQVRDDGPGLPDGAMSDTGVGLTNTRARLERLYGSRHRFNLSNAETGGAVVTIELPLEFYSTKPTPSPQSHGQDPNPDR